MSLITLIKRLSEQTFKNEQNQSYDTYKKHTLNIRRLKIQDRKDIPCKY